MGGIKNLQRPVGKLTRLAIEPCSVPPSIWIETSIPAIMSAIWTIIEPDLKETYHIATGHSLVCSFKQEIRMAAEESGGDIGEATRYVFRAAEWVDLAVWWLFLASVGADALYDWTSMAYRVTGCTGPQNRGSSDSPQGATTDITFDFTPSGFSWLTDDPLFPAFAPSVSVRPNHSWSIFWQSRGADVSGQTVPITAQIIEVASGTIIDSFEGQRDKTGKIAPAVVWNRGLNEHTILTEYSCIAWGMEATSHHEVFPFGPHFCHIFPLVP